MKLVDQLRQVNDKYKALRIIQDLQEKLEDDQYDQRRERMGEAMKMFLTEWPGM